MKSKSTVFEFIGEQHIEFVVYAFFYDNYRFFDLDHKSLFVWIAAMLGTDHGYFNHLFYLNYSAKLYYLINIMNIIILTHSLRYYWAHRFLHETNIGWSSHQVHHSSEARDFTSFQNYLLGRIFWNEKSLNPCLRF